MDNNREIKRFRSVPDYIGDLEASKSLASTIEKSYHAKGHTGVKVWVETDYRTGSPHYYVRSNVVMRVPVEE